jgi:hypothetical protein
MQQTALQILAVVAVALAVDSSQATKAALAVPA